MDNISPEKKSGKMHDMFPIRIKRLDPRATLPAYQTPGSAAFDLSLIEDITIPTRSFVKVRTGLVIQIPEHHVLLITARSSSPMKKGVTLANGTGIIDADYCGPEDELFLLLENLRDEPVSLQAGDRVCQALVVPVLQSLIEEVQEMTRPNRGGHGSTGQ